MTNKPLLSETALALRNLCASCGLPKTGPKRVLVQRLRRAAKQFQPVPPAARILSIDLGIRNFAFSLLSPVSPPRTSSSTQVPNEPLNSPVHLHAWHRLDLTLPDAKGLERNAARKAAEPALKEGVSEEEEKEGEEGDKEDAYSPTALAALTAHLVRARLLPLRPTHVLIERQRFRTGGAAAVFEWTLRVNSLEAMLHAAFAALLRRKTWSPDAAGSGVGDVREGEGGWDGEVYSVLPRAVAGYLFPADDAVAASTSGAEVTGETNGEKREGRKAGKAGAAYQLLKREKVAMLARYLTDQGLIIPEGAQTEEMVRLFIAGVEKRRDGKKKRRGEKNDVDRATKSTETSVEHVAAKLDDLSDAVLQGMVWLQWQKNMETLIKDRPELLSNEERAT
ncbi:hypothetical protein VTI28DRAFT_711 [Corynascus sepedonium]